MLSRRRLLVGSALTAGAAWAGRAGVHAAVAASHRGFALEPLARVIVDNDFAGDPDGLVALCRPTRRPPVAGGAEQALEAGDAPRESAAARAIVAEALRDDPLPLYCTCGGPLTNVASALLLEPRIAERMTIVWIGGAGYPQGGWEYNLASDVRAAQVVFDHSRAPLWQVPQPAYRSCQLAIAEMETQLGSAGPVGRWLLEHFQSMRPDWLKLGGTWPMGDSPLVMATALSSESSEVLERPAPRIGDDLRYGEAADARPIRVYGRIDFRLVLGDFLARLQLHGRPAR